MMKVHQNTWLSVFSCLVLLACVLAMPARSQMVTGSDMTDFAKTFDLRGGADFTVQYQSSSSPACVVWPGETPSFTFSLTNSGEDITRVTVDVVHYGTKGTPGDIWRPVVFKVKDPACVPVTCNVAIPRGATKSFTVTPKIPATFGGYALIVDLGTRGRKFGCTLARAVKADGGKTWTPTFALDMGWPFEQSEEVFRFFKRIGVKGARIEGGYNAINEQQMRWAMENDVTLMLTVGAAATPSSAMPLGRGRPWLNEKGEMMEGAKEDLAWLPSFDAEFQRYLHDALVKYGWPNGPVNAVELWNEPWEGVSISGWGADMLRFREIYTRMAQAVIDARRDAGVKVMIGGACSSSNTRDKLFSDGKDTFLPWLDFVSIHYQPLAADPVLQPEWMARKGEYGRVRVWDTESWVANTDDRVAGVIASMRSIGQDRTAGIFYGNVFDPMGGRGVQAWSTAASVAATTKFIGQRPFKEILFKNGLPWVYVFDGRPIADGSMQMRPDDGTVVILGDLGAYYERNRTLFRSVKIAPDARISFSNQRGTFILYDFYGNPQPAKNGLLTVPLNGLGYFVRTNGKKGSFAALRKAIANATITGIAPVEILAHDLTAPIETQPTMTLTVTNVLNRPISGILTTQMDGMTITPSTMSLKLKAHETRDVTCRVSAGTASAENTYKLLATFTAGKDGETRLAEVMHVNVIARRPITVDGALDDWTGAIPQTVGPLNAVEASMTEMAYLPFREWKTVTGSEVATGYLAYDERGFYFAAKTPAMKPMVRIETRNDDAYYYPAQATSKDTTLTWPEGIRRFSYRKDPDLPSGNGGYNVQIAFNCLPTAKKHLLSFPTGTMPRYMAYEDTDYEFALNLCQDGGTELFCLQRPGMWRKHFYPRQPKADIDGGPVKGDAKLVVNGNTVECFIPWSVIPEVKACADAGTPIKFTYRVNQGGTAYELAAQRSVSKDNPMTFHNDWSTHWANELAFQFMAQ